jgi:hypothetical protein
VCCTSGYLRMHASRAARTVLRACLTLTGASGGQLVGVGNQNTGFMSHKDFAMSLVASGNVSDIGKYLERVACMPPQPGKVNPVHPPTCRLRRERVR